VTHHRKFRGRGVRATDDRGVMGIHPNAELLFVFYRHPASSRRMAPIANDFSRFTLDTKMGTTKGPKLAKFQRVGKMVRSTLRGVGAMLAAP
jgi:hypothetical protein